MSACHCALLYYTTQHRTVLIIFSLILQTVIIAHNDVVYWRKGDRQDRTDYISDERCSDYGYPCTLQRRNYMEGAKSSKPKPKPKPSLHLSVFNLIVPRPSKSYEKLLTNKLQNSYSKIAFKGISISERGALHPLVEISCVYNIFRSQSLQRRRMRLAIFP